MLYGFEAELFPKIVAPILRTACSFSQKGNYFANSNNISHTNKHTT
jgi:hypothetical protein